MRLRLNDQLGSMSRSEEVAGDASELTNLMRTNILKHTIVVVVRTVGWSTICEV